MQAQNYPLPTKFLVKYTRDCETACSVSLVSFLKNVLANVYYFGEVKKSQLSTFGRNLSCILCVKICVLCPLVFGLYNYVYCMSPLFMFCEI